MGFNRRKLEERRRQAAEQEAAARRATERQVLEDADYLIRVWNERRAKRMPMLFSPTIGAAITAGYWFLQARCPACRTTGDVDLRMLDWHRGAAVVVTNEGRWEAVRNSAGMPRVLRWALALPSLRFLLLHRHLATIDEQAITFSLALAAYSAVSLPRTTARLARRRQFFIH
jgi:hypothetical protein